MFVCTPRFHMQGRDLGPSALLTVKRSIAGSIALAATYRSITSEKNPKFCCNVRGTNMEAISSK